MRRLLLGLTGAAAASAVLLLAQGSVAAPSASASLLPSPLPLPSLLPSLPPVPLPRRRWAGSTCSSFTSARTDVSSIPATDARAAVRRPTAMAIASSSSSSSGGIAVPAWSR